jgi:hypothetical protein
MSSEICKETSVDHPKKMTIHIFTVATLTKESKFLSVTHAIIT